MEIESSETLHGTNHEEKLEEDDRVEINTNPWTEVAGRRRRRNQVPADRPTVVIGTKNDDDLQAGDKTAWLYVGKLRQNTTKETVIRFLNKNGIDGDIKCEDLNSRGYHKAYKIGIPFQYLGNTNKPEFWPAGVIVRRFRFRRENYRREDEGATLE